MTCELSVKTSWKIYASKVIFYSSKIIYDCLNSEISTELHTHFYHSWIHFKWWTLSYCIYFLQFIFSLCISMHVLLCLFRCSVTSTTACGGHKSMPGILVSHFTLFEMQSLEPGDHLPSYIGCQFAAGTSPSLFPVLFMDTEDSIF